MMWGRDLFRQKLDLVIIESSIAVQPYMWTPPCDLKLYLSFNKTHSRWSFSSKMHVLIQHEPPRTFYTRKKLMFWLDQV